MLYFYWVDIPSKPTCVHFVGFLLLVFQHLLPKNIWTFYNLNCIHYKQYLQKVQYFKTLISIWSFFTFNTKVDDYISSVPNWKLNWRPSRTNILFKNNKWPIRNRTRPMISQYRVNNLFIAYFNIVNYLVYTVEFLFIYRNKLFVYISSHFVANDVWIIEL